MGKKRKARDAGIIKYPPMTEEVKKQRYDCVLSFLSNNEASEQKLLDIPFPNNDTEEGNPIQFNLSDPIPDQLVKHLFLTLFDDIMDFSALIIPSLIPKIKSAQFMKNHFVPLLKQVFLDIMYIIPIF